MEQICRSEKETYAYAKRVAKMLKGGDILVLSGDLGAGKTTFTKGLAKALGVKENVTSPTFTLMNQYDTIREKLYHFDMYRITDPSEVAEIGLNEFFRSNGICVIEWAENIWDYIPKKHLTIRIEKLDETTRKFVTDFEIGDEK